MAIWQGGSRRKSTGGLYRAHRKKRKYELGRLPVFTTVGERNVKKVRVRGGNFKLKLQADKYVNVYDPKTGKVFKAEIKTVIENSANMHFARRNIITRGAVLLTNLGKAKVTNRPSQEGIINAVLVEGAPKEQ
ncbi:MAG: 30S ribosomal protein S8e [Archaeoglobaceae archaeon]|nr:30S ribosomal protein S8e [Archaeoglobaceae archaeon]MCX8151533.1 30S ribosomal protein S8e [Archaeoglobaceae archaeon]MDW8013231.1 30S ribosomal protein S8e [Archaeoglobaceae archaeon]